MLQDIVFGGAQNFLALHTNMYFDFYTLFASKKLPLDRLRDITCKQAFVVHNATFFDSVHLVNYARLHVTLTRCLHEFSKIRRAQKRSCK